MKRVLIVDDSRFVYEEMKHMLEGSEFEPAAYCARGEDALDIYEGISPDVVSMDIILPGMDGFEATERLLKAHPEAKVVMVSSLAYDETESKALDIGVQAFVFKPFTKEQILEALRFAAGEDSEDIQGSEH